MKSNRGATETTLQAPDKLAGTIWLESGYKPALLSARLC
jgi:hypothetical protein